MTIDTLYVGVELLAVTCICIFLSFWSILNIEEHLWLKEWSTSCLNCVVYKIMLLGWGNSPQEHIQNRKGKLLELVSPLWMVKGRTVLIQKDPKKGIAASNYRPIACLPIMWKILTGIFADKIYDHLAENDLLPDEQKGCRKNSRGTKDQLLIDKAINAIFWSHPPWFLTKP